MAAKLTQTRTTYRVELSTKVLFVDEYDPEYRVIPTAAEVSTVDGKLDKIEFIGDDATGMSTMAMVRDLGRLSAHQAKVVAQALAACAAIPMEG